MQMRITGSFVTSWVKKAASKKRSVAALTKIVSWLALHATQQAGNSTLHSPTYGIMALAIRLQPERISMPQPTRHPYATLQEGGS